MREFLRPMLPMVAVLLVPIVPFVVLMLLYPDWNERIAAWSTTQDSRVLMAVLIIGLLASDIFLLVPSSVLCTAAGWQFGVPLGTFIAWAGLSLGTVIGFAMAKWIGKPIVAWLTTPAELERAGELTRQLGPWLLIVARGIPVVAEASVLFVGMHQMPWRQFLPPVLFSNLVLALVYAAFGRAAEEMHLLWLAIAVSIGAPVLMIAVFRAWLWWRNTRTRTPPGGSG
jgi:uncharacterized membrane protein YdjX (TVP38/TMEM64 family)